MLGQSRTLACGGAGLGKLLKKLVLGADDRTRGWYGDTHTKAPTALKGDQPPHLAAPLAADLHSDVNDDPIIAAQR